MDVATISGALSALNGARDIIKTLLSMHVTSEVEAKVIDLRNAIFDAQDKTQDARDELDAIRSQLGNAQREIAALKDHSAFVATLRRANGAYVAPDDPDPFCPRCIEVNTRPIHLINTNTLRLRIWVWACPECKTEVAWRGKEVSGMVGE